jgi:signal transduction histidine kinase/CheY-like chemotaxis protein
MFSGALQRLVATVSQTGTKRFPASFVPVGAGDRVARHGRPLVTIAFALVAAAVIAAVFVLFRASEADHLVSDTFEVRQVARDLMSALQDAESGQRGYLLTQDERYLEPFDRAVTVAPAAVDRLHKLASDDRSQQDRLNSVGPVIDAKLDELRQTVALMRQGQRDEALMVVKSDRGRLLMDTIRAQLDAFFRYELDLRGQHEANTEALRNWLLGLVGLGLAVATGLAGLLARSTLHFIKRLQERTAQLEAEVKLRSEAEDTLRQAHKMEAVGQLTGGIAHDFNNLLTIIAGNLDTIKRRAAATTQAQDAHNLAERLQQPLDLAMQGARSAAQLTHRLLAFARRQTLEPARLDLNSLVSGMSEMLCRTLGETIRVETVLDGGLWPTLADANQVENALINLAVNARDAMPDGGRLTIETANAYLDDAYARRFGDVAAGQYAVLSVSDTGTGMAADLLEKVFEPFFTTKPVGTGSGLGLAMVYGFVKQSGGHIRICSEVGHGTTVKIYLPRLLQAEQPAAAPAAKPQGAIPPLRARSDETVLLVEDNDGVREYAKSGLEEMGYRVLAAGDALEAFRLLGDAPRIDLLFTDVVLSGAITGRELANKVAAQYEGLLVLFTTDYTRNVLVHQGRLDADVHLLNKPYTQQDLARKIRELLDGRPIG